MKQTWWDQNLVDDKTLKEFKGWVGDSTVDTKVIPAKHIVKKGYESVLDIGCADGSFKKSLETEGFKGTYVGLDSSGFWIDYNKDKFKFIHDDLDDIQLADGSYECTFARHVLEHQNDFRKGLAEAVRVAAKECIVVFYKQPTDKEVKSYLTKYDLHDNIYAKDDIKKFLDNLNVKSYLFQEIHNETILYIEK
jgi:ubiquinone/menaquinone biosynthesis C-methylase UbiE